MKRLIIPFLCLFVATVMTNAQKYTVSGQVIDDTNEPVPMATVQVLSLPDSTFVTGAATTLEGKFSISVAKKGNYLLKTSFIGYTTHYTSVSLSSKEKSKDVGTIQIAPDTKFLQEAIVSGQAAQVQVSGDSLVYNASAFRIPEGSTLEALVKKLPGAQVNDDGSITVNGKTISKILVNGKEFFLNDTQVALKNIPTNVIDKIKSYDKKSDLARVTGIDDGEEETVLDLTFKKGMMNNVMANLDLGAGSKDRYTSRAYVNKQTENYRVTFVGSMNNINDNGFGGGWWGGNNGLVTKKEAGVNYAGATEKLETGGSLRYNYTGTDAVSTTASQNFVTSTGAFSNSQNRRRGSDHSVNADFRMEWKPDTMTNIIFRPSGSYNRNNGFNSNSSASFDDDPNDLVDNPLDEALKEADTMAKNILDIVVNTNASRSQSYSSTRRANGELQFNRRLGNKGRNITFRTTGGLNGSDSEQLSGSRVIFRPGNSELNRVTENNRYYNTPGRSHNYSLQATYSEPIWKQTFLQFSYQYRYSYNKNDRQAYVFEDGAFQELYDQLSIHRYDIGGVLDAVEKAFSRIPNDELSQFSEYRNYEQRITTMLRFIRTKYNFNVGVDVIPLHTTLNYKYMGKEYPDVKRNVTNVAPNLDLRYSFSKQHQLRFWYRGRSSQPSMTDLLDITDDSDPLNIRRGNPGLKPSFSNNFRLFYNNYLSERQQSYNAHIYFNTTRNQVSSRVSYDKETGVKTTRPENINGNWSTGVFFFFNSALDHPHKLTINAFTNLGYSTNKAYLDPTQYEEDQTRTKSWNVRENLRLSYKADLFDVDLKGSIGYNNRKNNVLTTNNLNTVDFTYGLDGNLNLPWNMSFSTDLEMRSRRGYSQASMNTNELVWNAKLSQSLLKEKNLTLSFEMYDILGKQSNLSRSISAIMSSDTQYNNIHQYCMFHLLYRLTIFGNKEARSQMGEGFGGFGGGGGPGGRGGGGRPGGAGGGRR